MVVGKTTKRWGEKTTPETADFPKTRTLETENRTEPPGAVGGAARCCEENTVNSLIAQSGAKKTGGMSRFHAMVLEDLDTLW